jgi:hypothetical protein
MKSIQFVRGIFKFILTIILFIISISVVAADYTIGPATISTDTTWSGSIDITGNITIENTGRLTISPGTILSFQGYYNINVKGNLKAIGALGDTVVFTRSDTTGFWRNWTSDGCWGGIMITNSSSPTDSIVFRFCKFKFIKRPGMNASGINLSKGYKMIVTRSAYNFNVGSITAGSGQLIIDSCTFLRNFYYGPTIMTYDINMNRVSKAIVQNCTISSSSYYNIYVNGSSDVVIRNNSINALSNKFKDTNTPYASVQINSNSVARVSKNILTRAGSFGGSIGIGVDNSTATIDSNSITGYISAGLYLTSADGYARKNEISTCADGIQCTSSNYYFANNYIHHNTGKGYYFTSFTVGTIENDIISYNKFTGISSNQSELKIYNSKLLNQTTNGNGVYCDKSKLQLFNCLIANNTSAKGSAIESEFSTVDIINSTIANNKDNDGNYGSMLFTSTSGKIANSIIYGNVSDATPRQICILSNDIQPSFYNCDIQGNSAAFHLGSGITFSNDYVSCLDVNPGFVSVSGGAGSGGQNALTANWTLNSSSKCINNGQNNYNNTTLDLAGTNRISNGIIDAGAFENMVPKDTNTLLYIYDEVRWMADTVLVNNNIIIYGDGKLIIDPGVTVLFTGNYQIKSYGTIKALGTANYKITFTINDTTGFSVLSGSSGGWRGIASMNDTIENDSTIFQYCKFLYLKPVYAGNPNYPEDYNAFMVNQRNMFRVSNCLFDNIIGNYSTKDFFKFSLSEVEFTGNEIENSKGLNSLFSMFSCNFNFSKNVVHNNINSLLYITSSDIKLCNNTFYNNKTGTNTTLLNVSTSKSIFLNNLFFNNEMVNYISFSRMISNTFANNLLALNKITLSAYLIYAENTIFENNIIYNNSFNGIRYNNAYPSIFRNSNFYPKDTKNPLTCVNCTYDNPEFISPGISAGYIINADSADWKLTDFSPCINAGYSETLNTLATDFAGAPRINGEIIDAGPYEHQGHLPEITIQPIGSLICEGLSYTFTLDVSDTADFQWQKDGINISHATNKTLTITNVSELDKGQYSCNASNGYGTIASNGATLNVKSKAKILSTPESRFVIPGSPLSIEVPVSGTIPIMYNWYKNDTLDTLLNTRSIKYNSFDIDNEGTYYLIASNECGEDTTNEFAMNLYPKAILSGSVCEGENIMMLAKAGFDATYQWYKDGETVTGEIKDTLVIDSIIKSNDGTYTCLVSGVFQSTETNALTISVKQKPDITSQPSSALVTNGSEVRLAVNAIGTTPFVYKWYNNDTLITVANNATLVINAFNSLKEGNYKMLVTNFCGTDSTEPFGMFIEPNITIKNNDTLFCEGERIVFNEHGKFPAAYQWYKDGVAINGANNDSLVVVAKTINDKGTYNCLVTSNYGIKLTNSKTITISEAPQIMMQPLSQWTEIGSSCSVATSANGSKPMSFEWYKNDTLIPYEDDAKIVLINFTPGDEGIYFCEAKNICGADTTDKVALYLKPLVTVLTNDSLPVVCTGDTFKISTGIDFPAEFHWLKDGKAIPGATNKTFIIPKTKDDDQGNYSCRVNTAYQTINTDAVLLQVRTSPEIIEQTESTLVQSHTDQLLEVKADGYRPIQYQWTKDGYDINGATNYKIKIDSFDLNDEGIYLCRITNRCGSYYSNQISLYLVPEICMVTVTTNEKDPIGHNTIVWEKRSKIFYKQYNIYRQTSSEGSYVFLGSVQSNENSIFEDTLVDPARMAYYYKITATDSNNLQTEIDLCKPHKNIHLMVTQEYGKPNLQLLWDEYIGFDYKTFYIYRSSNDIGGFGDQPYDSIASTNLAWTDIDVVPASSSSDPVYYYFISVKKEIGCDSRLSSEKKAGGGLFSQSESNIEDNRLQSSNSINPLENNIYELSCSPNPFHNTTEISFKLTENSDIQLGVYDIMGQNILNIFNTKQLKGNYKIAIGIDKMKLQPGIYLVKLKIGGNITALKLVKQ